MQYRQEVAARKVRRFRHLPYWGKPVPGFGDAAARLLVVGLAPAAHGGNRTGRTFTGDQSGDWLFAALYAAGFANQPTSRHRDDGLRLHDCYITQVVRCAPPGNKPLRQEIANCFPYLVQEWQRLPRVQVIVPLGRIAFDACLRLCRHLGLDLPRPLPRFAHGRLYALAGGRYSLLPSYHPSRQNTQTGRLTRPMLEAVFATARALLAGR